MDRNITEKEYEAIHEHYNKIKYFVLPFFILNIFYKISQYTLVIGLFLYALSYFYNFKQPTKLIDYLLIPSVIVWIVSYCCFRFVGRPLLLEYAEKIQQDERLKDYINDKIYKR